MIRFSSVLLARTCNAVMVFAASALLVGVQYESAHTVHDIHYESAALPCTFLCVCVCVMGRGRGMPTIHMCVRVHDLGHSAWLVCMREHMHVSMFECCIL